MQATEYADTNVVTFGAVESDGKSTACLAYEYDEMIASPDGPFSLSLTLERDSENKTWYDKIFARDLVFIKEHGKLKYIGVVKNKRYQARMGDRGPERKISISGMSLGGLLVEFTILLDLHILASSETSDTAQRKYMESLASNVAKDQTLAAVLQSIKDAYFRLMEETGGNQNVGVKHVIEKFFDWKSKMSSSVVAKYPIVVSAFQTGENNLWSTIQQVLNPPFHEMFSLLDPGSKQYQLWFRQTPFDPADWAALTKWVIPDDIPALLLQDYDVGASDQDVKTWFICTLPGSAISREKALTLDAYSRSSVKDDAKWPYYGFRPMYVESRWFNRSEENQKDFTGAEALMQELSERLFNWYSNNANFLTGTLTIMSVENEEFKAVPRIGEKIGFLGGEFYIEAVRSSWEYGGVMTKSLSLSRGYMYDSSGNQVSPIEQIGPKIGVLEAPQDE